MIRKLAFHEISQKLPFKEITRTAGFLCIQTECPEGDCGSKYIFVYVVHWF